jgi:hypothetical protein
MGRMPRFIHSSAIPGGNAMSRSSTDSLPEISCGRRRSRVPTSWVLAHISGRSGIGAADFIQVGEVLWSSGTLFGQDQVGLS